MITVWVLILYTMGPSFTDNFANLGTYATQEDCQKVIAAARDIHDLRPGAFRCIAVQKLPT